VSAFQIQGSVKYDLKFDTHIFPPTEQENNRKLKCAKKVFPLDASYEIFLQTYISIQHLADNYN
jgi:hypothetical protein